MSSGIKVGDLVFNPGMPIDMRHNHGLGIVLEIYISPHIGGRCAKVYWSGTKVITGYLIEGLKKV